MTSIELIYGIKSAVLDLQKYTSKDAGGHIVFFDHAETINSMGLKVRK